MRKPWKYTRIKHIPNKNRDNFLHQEIKFSNLVVVESPRAFKTFSSLHVSPSAFNFPINSSNCLSHQPGDLLTVPIARTYRYGGAWSPLSLWPPWLLFCGCLCFHFLQHSFSDSAAQTSRLSFIATTLSLTGAPCKHFDAVRVILGLVAEALPMPFWALPDQTAVIAGSRGIFTVASDH